MELVFEAFIGGVVGCLRQHLPLMTDYGGLGKLIVRTDYMAEAENA